MKIDLFQHQRKFGNFPQSDDELNMIARSQSPFALYDLKNY